MWIVYGLKSNKHILHIWLKGDTKMVTWHTYSLSLFYDIVNLIARVICGLGFDIWMTYVMKGDVIWI